MFLVWLHLACILCIFKCVFADWSLFSDLDDLDTLNGLNGQDYPDDFDFSSSPDPEYSAMISESDVWSSSSDPEYSAMISELDGSSSSLDPDYWAMISESDGLSSLLEPDFSAFIPESDHLEMIPASDNLKGIFPSENPEMIPEDLFPVDLFTSCLDDNIGQVSKLKIIDSSCPVPDQPFINVPQFPNIVNINRPRGRKKSDNICSSRKYRKNVSGRDTPIPVCGSGDNSFSWPALPRSTGPQFAGYYAILEFSTLSKSISLFYSLSSLPSVIPAANEYID
jgi:hypothetical protein